MANNTRAMPMFVIDTCSSEDNKESKSHPFPRSLSLLNYDEAYKDLSGTIHYSSLNRLKNSFIRSHSCPQNYFSNESSSSSTNINLLDPSNGIHSPAGSSSRYSLYGSFFDLSEKSFVKTDKKLLTINGYPLLIIDNSSKLLTNSYQDKCNDWLNHLNIM